MLTDFYNLDRWNVLFAGDTDTGGNDRPAEPPPEDPGTDGTDSDDSAQTPPGQ
jgi:hypothetical protein